MLEILPALTNGMAIIQTANNGKEAVDRYQECSEWVKLILIDCEMPVMDGYQAVKLIREQEIEKGLPRTLIVGVSGNSGDQYDKKCRANGMDQLITKPVNIG